MPPSAELEIARRLPPAHCTLPQAQSYTRWLATHHYENFHVVSWLLPRRLRQHFYNVYAYCRWADDLGDEIGDPGKSLELLDAWEKELDACYAGRASHPIFVALAPTIHIFDIPAQPFRDLLTAFRQDQRQVRYESWDDVLNYCRYSANPVGRLVLYLSGYRDAERQQLSDATCTALQLANFWQDVARDLDKGRIYIPRDLLRAHGLDFEDVVARRFDPRCAALMADLIARTRILFAQGWPLAATVDARLRVDLELFSRGGMAVLDGIQAAAYNTLANRPAIGNATRARLMAFALAGKISAAFRHQGRPGSAKSGHPTGLAGSTPPDAKTISPDDAIEASYHECRHVTREAASNFYYAFFMLPRAKRDALCALYAFMRLVDDVSDGPTHADGTVSQQNTGAASAGSPQNDAAVKRAGLARWRGLLDRAVAGDTAGHPILPAFADTIRRYQIPDRYFHDLISGAEMDLTETHYATFERLREYCYRVAGTVGLTCTHVFGFEDAHALELAEQLGIAFQLTNILRDVGADLAMGRVYLPADELTRFGCSLEELREKPRPGSVTPAARELLRAQAQRAWQFYSQGAGLLHHVQRDSRAALWALVRIYSSLLARIESRDYDVFSSRVRLSGAEKARILVRARLGWWSEADVLEERDRDRRRPGGAFLGRRAG